LCDLYCVHCRTGSLETAEMMIFRWVAGSLPYRQLRKIVEGGGRSNISSLPYRQLRNNS